MRYPLDTIYVGGYGFREVTDQKTGLPDAQGVKRHIGVDLRAAVGTPVYAPGPGVVTQSYVGGAGQTIELRIGGLLWRFMHLNRRDVAVGQSVGEGQVIGLSGNSGGVAAHLHVDARRDGTSWNASLNNYVDPLAIIAMSVTQGGNKVFENDAQIQAMYYLLRGKDATPQEVAGWRGKPILQFATNQHARQEVANREAYKAQLEQRVRDLEEALRNEQNKPPKEVIKEVEKIVEVPIEVVKEVPIIPDEKAVVEGFFKRIWNALFKKG